MTLIDPKLSRNVWKLAYPIILANISHTLLNVVDTIMLGRLSSAALAAAGIGGLVYLTLIVTLGAALGLGTQILTARRYGGKKFTQCGKVLDSSLVLAFILGGIFTFLSPWLAHSLTPFLESDPTMGKLLGTYMQYRFYGTIFALISLSFGGFFNGIGKTKIRMNAAIILTVTNILLDYFLIFGKFGFPELGVKGAALASTLAIMLVAIYYIGVSIKNKYRLQYNYFHPANIDFPSISKIWRISLPLMCRSLVGMGGFLAFFWIIGRIGTLELATSNILRSLNSISYMFGIAIGTAATTLVGQNMGAEEYEIAESSGWEAVKLGMMIMGALGILFIFLPSPIMRLYTNDLEVIRVGVTVLRILGIVQIFNAIGTVLSPALIGAGDIRFILGAEIGITCLAYLPMAWFLGIHIGFGIIGAWVAEVIYVLFYALVMGIRFKEGSWKGIRV